MKQYCQGCDASHLLERWGELSIIRYPYSLVSVEILRVWVVIGGDYPAWNYCLYQVRLKF